MRTGLCLGVYNYALVWFYFKLECLAAVLTLQRPRPLSMMRIHRNDANVSIDSVCQWSLYSRLPASTAHRNHAKISIEVGYVGKLTN
jgi:hypothetical protein